MRIFFIIAACFISLLGKGQAAFIVPKSGPAFVQDSVKIKFWDSAHSETKYTSNGWVSYGSNLGATSAPFLYSTGVQSPITMAVGNINDMTGNTAGYGSSNTMGVPQQVLQTVIFGSSATLTFTFNNLPGSKYTIIFFSSTSLTTNPAYHNTFTSGAASSGPTDAFNNLSTPNPLTNLTPSSGTIIVTVTKGDNFEIADGCIVIRTAP